MKYSPKWKRKYRKLIDSVSGFDDLSWYKTRRLNKVLKHKERYQAIAEELNIPVAFLVCVHVRERGSDVGKFKTHLANGQKLKKRTTIVPKGIGPFTGPDAWEQSVRYIIKQKGLDEIGLDKWTEERFLFECEKYNGPGYHNRGKESPYLWSFTFPHTNGTGLFVKDHVYKPNAVDENIGVWAFYQILAQADADFAIGSEPTKPVLEVPKESSWADELIDLFVDVVGGLFDKKQPIADEPPAEVMNRNKAILLNFKDELGVKEWKNGSNPRVEEYHKYASKDNNKKWAKDDIPWCSSFMCFLDETALIPMGSTNSMLARSYEKWGRTVKRLGKWKWLPGDKVTFYRKGKDSGLGHVGVLLHYDEAKGLLYVGGGNQNDEVNVSVYTDYRMTDIRRSSKLKSLNEAEVQELHDLAKAIMDQDKIIKGGKVA